jgi:hypothetical protein
LFIGSTTEDIFNLSVNLIWLQKTHMSKDRCYNFKYLLPTTFSCDRAVWYCLWSLFLSIHLSWMNVEWSSLYTCHGWVWNDLPCTLVMNECGMIFPVHFSWMSVESSSLYFNVVLAPYCRCQWSKILLTFFVKGKMRKLN